MGKIGRNDPCPCGSGEKFKKCCLDNIDKPDNEHFIGAENFFGNFKNLKKDSQIKQCLYPDKTSCSEKIIKAHSIQNNKILKKISSNGKVYMPRPKTDNPFAMITEYGRKEASVFTGFCGHHDKTLFQPIEDRDFIGSKEQIFLYTYRAFAVEYHNKQEVNKMGQLIYKNKPSLLKTLTADENPYSGFNLALQDFEPVKKCFDSALLNKDYNILTSIVWEFDKEIKFAGTGFQAPTKDLNGNTLQDLGDKDNLVKHMFISIFPENGKSYCIISWLKDNDALFLNYRNQLNTLNIEQRKVYINNLLPRKSENIAVNPEAWDAWDENKKEEFGSILWGMAEFTESLGLSWSMLEPTAYDLFEM